ncbi:MAG TPA: amino acid permease [Terriglobales bacterium]|nr:amino acid permease [Terriglobales bacterium]
MPEGPSTQPDSEAGLHKQLSAGKIAMLAVGGSIGTGLLLGSAEAIHIAGPAVVLSFLLGGAVIWTVAMAMGELASAHPAAGSFGVYADLYLNRWAGFVARYGYWYAMVVAIGAELLASATYVRHWFPQVPALVWIALFGALLVGMNLMNVGRFGTFEYWFAMMKVAAIAAFILGGAALIFSGRAESQLAPTATFVPNGWLAIVAAMPLAVYTFGGVEMVAISSGEARSAKDVARATHIMFAVLAFVYIGSILVLAGSTPWTLYNVEASPFVTAAERIGLPAAGTVLNLLVLVAALSGANASLYVAARMLFSLARSGFAPAALGRLTAAGSPRLALVCSSGGIVVAMAAKLLVPQSAFLYVLGAALFGGMLAWWIALAAHISFRRKASKELLASLPMRAPGGAVASVLGFAGMAVAFLATWHTSLRITMICAPILLAALTVAYYIMRAACPASPGS